MTERNTKPMILLCISMFCVGAFGQLACDGQGTGMTEEDDDDNDNDNDNDNSGNDDDEPDCRNIEWSTEEHYLAKGSIVAKWKQSAFIDTNDNGKIDEDEEEDEDFTFVDLCESGKKSLVLLMATDD